MGQTMTTNQPTEQSTMNTNFQLTIDTGNAAFGPAAEDRAAEIARILRDLAAQLDCSPGQSAKDGYTYDTNGNKVGRWTLDAFDPAQHGAEDEDEGGDPDLVQELAGYYGRGTACTVYTYPAGAGYVWYAVEGSQNVNKADSAFLVHAVDVETLADVDTFTASGPVNSAEDMARECFDM